MIPRSSQLSGTEKAKGNVSFKNIQINFSIEIKLK